MSVFTEPLAQVREALTSLYGDTDVRFDSRVHLDTGLSALDRVERLATDMETALRRFEWLDKKKHDRHTEAWLGFFDEAMAEARVVLSARKEGTA